MTTTVTFSWAQIATIVGVFVAVMGGYLYHFEKRLDGLEKRMDGRFDALQHEIDKRFDDLKDWIRSEIKRVEDRIDHIEHPVTRP